MKDIGFTLIEVLIAVSVFVIGLTLSLGIITGIMSSPKTRETLSVTQASSEWFENVSKVWIDGSEYGRFANIPVPTNVAKTTWSVEACEVNISTTPETVTCGTPVSSGKPLYSGGSDTPNSNTQVVRLNLKYTSSGGGNSTTTSLEVSRR